MKKEEIDALVLELRSDSPEKVAQAAKRIQDSSTPADVPMLIELLKDSDFVVREAAAWPLSDMGRVETLPDLFIALQRGFEEGWDNDGLLAAISDMACLYKSEVKTKLIEMSEGADENLNENIEWLLEYCEPGHLE